MGISDKFKKKRESIQIERQRLAMERAQSSVKKLLESEQFRLSALALPDSQMAVDAIIQNTVASCLNPCAEFIDTLKAKGFRKAEIRKYVHSFFINLNCMKDGFNAEDYSYEDMLDVVANHFAEHQELYNSLNPDELRQRN